MQPFEAMEILERNLDSPDHRFWPEDAGLLAMQPAIRARILGPKQVNDAQLLDLALRHEGVLATFDQRIANLLPPGDPRLERIRLMPL